MARRRTSSRERILALLGLLLGCAPQPSAGGLRELDGSSGEGEVSPRPDDAAGSAKQQQQTTPISVDPVDSSALTLQPSQETIHMWGGLYDDATLEAPMPLIPGVVGPGDPLDFVRVHCLIRGPQEQAKVRCRAAGRSASPSIAKSWHDRLNACTEVHERAPTRAELRKVQATWKAIVEGPDFQSKGMTWSAARYAPPALTGTPALLEVAITHEWKGPERVGRGCENVPPDQGCDPYVVDTGRTITLTRDAVRYGYSEAPDVALERLFGGRAPLLHRVRIGTANAQGFVEEHPSLKVDGSNMGIEDYRRRQLAALDAFEAAVDQRPEVLAAIHINKAITALHLKDLALLRAEVDALRKLLASARIDRGSLMIDNALAVFDRVLAKEWLLEDPCPPP